MSFGELTMKRKILISILVLLAVQPLASAVDRPVPSRMYPTIQSAISASSDGDTVIVAPGTYSGQYNHNLDFAGKKITVRSEINPANPWGIIANTIIDCGGKPVHTEGGDGGKPNRAFRFHTGEDANSRVLGLTIINGYTRGPKGKDGEFGYVGDPLEDFIPIPVGDDPLTVPPYALDGDNASGHAWGGAVLCEAGSSPTIKYCVFKNCTVTGAEGGRGADGIDANDLDYGDGENWFHWTLGDESEENPGEIDDVNNDMTENNPDGQWAGWGGTGSGDGYGGAIACKGSSSPVISECVFQNNFARGAVGGDGGQGGDGYEGGEEGPGGNGGLAVGDGRGGALYCELGSNPAITSCTFTGNVATIGIGGEAGPRGAGSIADPRNPTGGPGVAFADELIAGGAAYYTTTSGPDFVNCTFADNKAYRIPIEYQLIGTGPAEIYEIGGAIYAYRNTITNIDTCDFIDNLGGAIYFEKDCTVSIHNSYDPNRDCLFSGNSDPHARDDLEGGTGSSYDYGSGGAIFIGTGCDIDLRSCNFGGNSAKYDGGAVESRSDLRLTDCSFGGNTAADFGGAVDLFDSVAFSTLNIDANGCSFAGNQATYGGGFATEDFNAVFVNCFFSDNVATVGGGLDVGFGNIEIISGGITGNNATHDSGGGLSARYTSLTIQDCLIKGNSSDAVIGTGGGININGEASPQLIKNCLITDNYATTYGGALCIEGTANPVIQNCTFSDNLADGFGGAIFSDWRSFVQISDCIFQSCSSHAIHEEDDTGDASVAYSLFYLNPGGDYYDSGTALTYTGASDIPSIPGGSNNMYDDPIFVSDPEGLGDFYLSEPDTAEPIQIQRGRSPAVNAGSAPAISLGLDTYTTRTDDVLDSGTVDIGYHYTIAAEMHKFYLTTMVVGGVGTLEPQSGEYYAGETVGLTATPEAGWRVKAWTGTDNDASKETTNTVFMNTDKIVTVEFEQPRILTVGIDVNYPTIESALDDAEDGDTIIVPPGVWYGPAILVNKSVTLRSMDPNSPEATVIDRTDYVDPAFIFDSGADSDCVLEGFTIRNCRWQPGQAPDPADCPCFNGIDGRPVEGGAILILPYAGPTIRNCIIRDTAVRGGDGSDGCGSSQECNGGRGGWGGWFRGGGVYCGAYSTPTFINCQIVDNEIGGGNGGFGGSQSSVEDGWPNYGGNWSAPGVPFYGTIFPPHPDIHNYDRLFDIIPEGVNLWEVWMSTWGDYIGDGRWYSAYGGGAYCAIGSNVKFIDCTISGNRAVGGMTGAGGTWAAGDNEPEPEIPYQLPSYGGGVYCAADATVTFTRCTISDNVAVRPDEDLDAFFLSWGREGPNDTRAYYHIDPYLGHGGGVCAEESAMVTFTDCLISDNEAAAGGGVYFKGSNVRIVDSDVVSNVAYEGGGILGIKCPATIIGSNIAGNEAFGYVTNPNGEDNDPNDYDPNANYYLPGDGGGIHCDSTCAKIMDCNITGNEAGALGGGVYFVGDDCPSLINCLLTDNTAGSGGGAVSTSIFAQATVSNCTIFGNRVTGGYFPFRYGGGLYCFDQGNTNVIDSIIWGNVSQYGNQIAVDRAPATVSVNYSDVQDGATGVYLGTDCTLNGYDPDYPELITNLHGTSYDDPNFVFGDLGNMNGSGHFFLSQPAAGANQTVISSCVDVGSDDAHSLDLYRHTTRTDGVLDGADPEDFPDANVDMGYHYVLRAQLKDRMISLHWLESGCEFPDWCHGMDLNQDGRVSMEDYAIFADNYWLEEDTAPEPNPMTWLVRPVSTGDTEITMVATTATDNTGAGVEYKFECVLGKNFGGSDRPWDPCSMHVDTGLVKGEKYGYKVKARDVSVNLNETKWSFIGYAIAGEGDGAGTIDMTAPSPDPMEWATVPYGSSETSITMIAATATDDSGGVQYYFAETSGNPGGTVSDWQSSPTYVDDGLVAGLTYTYRVKARDVSTSQNETTWSTSESAIPEEGIEPPPTLIAPYIVSATQFDGGFDWYNVIVADTIGEAALYYRFVSLDNAALNSGWVPSTGTGTVPSGLGVISYEGTGVTYTVPVGPSHMTWQWQVCGSNFPSGDPSLCSNVVMILP